MPFTVMPGRRLRWSPRWPGEDTSVLFDGASGDFWVLDHEARELLERLAAVASGADSQRAGGASSMLKSLADAELITQGSRDGVSPAD